MNTKFKLFVLLFVCSNIQAQNLFEQGYFIDNSNQIFNCLIRNMDWDENPTKFEYKMSESSETLSQDINNVKEFSVSDAYKYIRREVKIDRSIEHQHNLSSEKEPILKKEVLFLRVLIEGKANLYSFVDKNLIRYFFNVDNADIEQLIFKSYQINKNYVNKNNKFRQQLFLNMQCATINNDRFEKIECKEGDLTGLFVDYNTCNNALLKVYNQKEKRDFFNLNIRPRIINASFSTRNDDFDERYSHDFGSKTIFGLGLEFEIVLPFNNDKWSFIVEPTYMKYSDTNRKEPEGSFSIPVVGFISYQTIELPIGIRHYFFLNNHSKLFVNAQYVVDLLLNNKYGLNADDTASSTLVDFDLVSSGNFAFGVGYNFKNKFQVEFRTHTPKSLINSLGLDSEFRSSSIVLGYTLF